MSSWENLSDEQLREYLINSALEVYVVTNPFEVGRDLDSNCFYEILANHPLDDGEISLRYAAGSIAICDCTECGPIRKELSEFYSMVEALTWVKENLQDASINLCKEAYNGIPLELILKSISRGNGCTFCKGITGELHHLLNTLNVKVWGIERQQKHDILPYSSADSRRAN